jgi:hypothetical protein
MARLDLSLLPRKYQDQVAVQLYAPHNPGPGPVPKPAPEPEPVGPGPAKEAYPGKYAVCVVSYRRRLLDEDNLCPKYHIDSLRYAGLLPSDAPDKATIKTSQVQVRTKAEERTVISIVPA